MDDKPLNKIVRKFLAKVSTLGLATVDEHGRPHAANVNFVADDDLNCYFLTSGDSQHGQHIAAHPHVAATAYTSFRLPHRIRGVQLRGRCTITDPCDFDHLWKMFCKKFPYARLYKKRAKEECFYKFRPDWLCWTDNTVCFGYKVATDWPPEK